MSHKNKLSILETGKRKTAIAKATINPGNGTVRINKILLDVVLPEISKNKIKEALLLTGDVYKNFDIDVNVNGGGFSGQAEAARMALSRVLLDVSKNKILNKKIIDYDRTILAGDSRRTEPKKFGGPGARTRKQKSYR